MSSKYFLITANLVLAIILLMEILSIYMFINNEVFAEEVIDFMFTDDGELILPDWLTSICERIFEFVLPIILMVLK